MEAALVQLGVGGIFSILVLKEVFAFIPKMKYWRNGNGNGNGSRNASNRPLDSTGGLVERRQVPEACVRMIGQVDHLFSSQQADSIHLSHTREMLEKAVDRLAETVDDQSNALQKISQATTQSCETLIVVQQKLTEISITMHA